jgi:Ribbon-helix-helix domain
LAEAIAPACELAVAVTPSPSRIARHPRCQILQAPGKVARDRFLRFAATRCSMSTRILHVCHAMPQNKNREKRVFTGVYFDRGQHDALRQLSNRTRVPLAVYLREAVDDLLKKYKVRIAARKRRR